MNNINFVQVLIFSILFAMIIGFFKAVGLDMNFIMTLLLSIFTIAISIFFYSKSTEVSQRIMEKIGGIGNKVEKIEKRTSPIEGLNSLKTLVDEEQMKRWLLK